MDRVTHLYGATGVLSRELLDEPDWLAFDRRRGNTRGAYSQYSYAGLSPAGYVFRPQQITPQTVHDLVAEYAEMTRLAPLAPHDLRRTFAKLSRNGGAELDQIKASLGHASVQTTERYVGDTQRFDDAPADRVKDRDGVMSGCSIWIKRVAYHRLYNEAPGSFFALERVA